MPDCLAIEYQQFIINNKTCGSQIDTDFLK